MKGKASFGEPILLLPSSDLPNGTAWLYELKLDGYGAVALRSGGEVHLRSRNDNDFNKRYPHQEGVLYDDLLFRRER